MKEKATTGNLSKPSDYQMLIDKISVSYSHGQRVAIQSVNVQLLETYWQIGQYIIEFEQKGNVRAKYGKALISNLAKDLSRMHGKGFSISNVKRFRQFYLAYPIGATLSHQLSWSHVVEILKIDDPLERNFYEKQTQKEKWTVRELMRQKNTALFQRLSLSKNKADILKLSAHGQSISSASDIVRDPYIFEFLKIPEEGLPSEHELENHLCNNLQQFLLELGKGFTYVGRQFRMTINNKHYRVDLVFYHRILRCFILVDLKINEVQHDDIGQMNLYLGYFAKEENTETDNPPIGIILTKNKDELLVEYATYGMSSQLFISKYQLYLPDKTELINLISSSMQYDENNKTETND
ncbi:MAG: PDDEXK nuclease domain-containing protein [Ferruginibacter sp.]